MKGGIKLDEKAQVSIELIVVLAAVVAIVLLLVGQLQETSKEGVKEFDETTSEVFKEIKKINS